MTGPQRVLVLTTVGADGYPHHAFLAEDEVEGAGSPRRLLTAPRGSRTAANLESGRVATLLSVDRGALRVVKLRRAARSVPAGAARRAFSLDVVADGLSPLAPGERARVAGLTFRREGSAR